MIQNRDLILYFSNHIFLFSWDKSFKLYIYLIYMSDQNTSTDGIENDQIESLVKRYSADLTTKLKKSFYEEN